MENIIENTRDNILSLIEQKLDIIPNWRAYPELRSKYDWLLEVEKMLLNINGHDSELEDLKETIERQKNEIDELEEEIRRLEDE